MGDPLEGDSGGAKGEKVHLSAILIPEHEILNAVVPFLFFCVLFCFSVFVLFCFNPLSSRGKMQSP